MRANTVTRLVLLAQLISVAGYAQSFETIKGIVADSATHRPIQFVNVVIKNTSRGVATDEKGYFSLQASTADTLLFSYVGYKTLEFPLADWEPSVILMPEEVRMLNTVIVKDAPLADPYENLFEEENIRLKNSQRTIPFYYLKDKKEKIKIARAKNEAVRVKHYVDLMVKDDKVKNYLMKKYNLSEDEYYTILTRFNEKNYAIMYYLTDPELLSMLYRFYEVQSDIGD